MEFQDKPKNPDQTVPPSVTDDTPPIPVAPQLPSLWKSSLNADTIKRFFQVTGGSTLYCLSAVFIAYGIIKLLRPVLVGSESISDAIPCLLTMHAYELTLLGVLLLIVFKKVVDDAISLTILIALFLVGTSIALGSVADRGITPAIILGLGGVLLGIGKLYAMQRFAKIPFAKLSMIGLGIIIAYNYWGPALMARSIAANPDTESARRGLWLLIYLVMLGGAVTVIVEAVRQRIGSDNQTDQPFLQRPAMAYIFALIITAASGVHQYWMAYAFTLERVLMDYVPIVAVCCLLLIEILRLTQKRNAVFDVLIACIPLAMVLLAIEEKSVLSSGKFGLGWLCYPPVILTAIGLATAALAKYHKWKHLWIAVYLYVLGILLTLGFAPEYPYKLSYITCIGTMIITLYLYGLIHRNPYICLASVLILWIALANYDPFLNGVKPYGLTQFGGLCGVVGTGILLTCMIFVKQLPLFIRFMGAVGLAVFVYDYLPPALTGKFLLVLLALGIVITALWIRGKDLIPIIIICLPVLARVYIMAKALANWRYIILGFLVLIAGAFVSLFKKPASEEIPQDNEIKIDP